MGENRYTTIKTNWQKIMKAIQKEKNGRGHPVYTHEAIEEITGIGVSTLSRLKSGSTTMLDYDSGIALIKLRDSLK